MTELTKLIYYWKITQLDLERFASQEFNLYLKETLAYLTELKHIKDGTNE